METNMKKIALFLSCALLASTFWTHGEFRAGSTVLRGDWTVERGGLDLDGGAVFIPGSKVRGTLGTSILQKTQLTDLDLQNVDFDRSDISGADFSRSNLKGAKLSRAKVAKADFRQAIGLTKSQKEDLKRRGALV
jgi:uncharacterized protein YjbI with pentapeptide repeats